jgi:hypothetical protein
MLSISLDLKPRTSRQVIVRLGLVTGGCMPQEYPEFKVTHEVRMDTDCPLIWRQEVLKKAEAQRRSPQRGQAGPVSCQCCQPVSCKLKLRAKPFPKALAEHPVQPEIEQEICAHQEA